MRFRTIFLIIALTELVSLVAHFFPWLNTIGFFVIIAAALVLSLKRLEYGLCFVLADLILGGKTGALFSFEYSEFFLSLRMALFIVVIGVWAGKMMSAWTHNPSLPARTSQGQAGQPPLTLRGGALRWWGLLGVAIIWGLVVGFLRGNNFEDLFLDANGYFYAALVLPFALTVMRMDANEKREWMRMLWIVFFATTTWVALETLFLLYFWTHGLNDYIAANLRPVYEWIRDTGVGEITWLEGNFARVFLQSQIYNVMAFFAVLVALITPPTSPYLKRRKLVLYVMLILNTAVILTSLSRSFWVGTLVGLVVLAVLIFQMRRRRIRQLGQMALIVISATALALGVIFAITRFPFPQPSTVNLTFLKDRSRIGSEATAASRWNLLPPMISVALQHPIIGSGFGANVTYISNDPRIREVSVTGEYTTYAFEWGWIDVWLKMGILGLIGSIGLIGALTLNLYQRAKTQPIYLAGFAGIASLATIHFFTPYLNHPLGFGILILGTVLLIE